MELNSIEAIKNAVTVWVRGCFCFHNGDRQRIRKWVFCIGQKIKEVDVGRTLAVIVNPNRYCSKAAEAFSKEILPQFTTRDEFKKLDSLYKNIVKAN